MDKPKSYKIMETALRFNLDIAKAAQVSLEDLPARLRITYFCYAKFYSSGEILRACSHKEWTKEFFSKEFYNDQELFLFQIQNTLPQEWSFFIMTGKPKGEHLKALYYKDIWHILHMYRKGKEETELFSFATERTNQEICNFYLNHVPLLKNFSANFLSEYKGELEYHIDKVIPSTIFGSQENYSNPPINGGLHVPRFYLNSQNYITGREMDCVRALIGGLTIKEVAQSLNLSSRTVEDHVQKVKLKTKSFTKAEMIQSLREAGLLLDIEGEF